MSDDPFMAQWEGELEDVEPFHHKVMTSKRTILVRSVRQLEQWLLDFPLRMFTRTCVSQCDAPAGRSPGNVSVKLIFYVLHETNELGEMH